MTSTTADPSDSLDQLHLLHGRLHFLHGVVYSSHAFTSFNDNHHNQGFTSSTSTTTTLSNMNWTLTSFEHMTTQQRLSTLLSHASPDTVVTTLRIHVRPLMGKSRQSMCLKTWTQALHLYCVKSAQKTTPDGLRIAGTWCGAVLFVYFSFLYIIHIYRSVVVTVVQYVAVQCVFISWCSEYGIHCSFRIISNDINVFFSFFSFLSFFSFFSFFSLLQPIFW